MSGWGNRRKLISPIVRKLEISWKLEVRFAGSSEKSLIFPGSGLRPLVYIGVEKCMIIRS